MRRRQEPRRKRQSNFPRKEERFLGLALRMPSRRGLPGHSPGSLGRKAKEPASLPPSPDRTGVSLGFFAYPPPKPWSTFPWHPQSHQSLLSFPSGTPISFLHAPAVPHPPSPKPPSPAAAPDSHLPPGTLSIHSWHRRCQSAPRCPQPWPKAAWDPSPGVPQPRHPGGTGAGDPRVPLEGTARFPRGQWLLAPPHTLSLGCWGVRGGEVLVGTLRSRRRASSLAAPGLRGPGSEPLQLKPAPPGLG